MKKGSVFINIGRGQSIDESALIFALESRHIGAAYLDVFVEEPLPKDSPFWDLQNCYIVPHSMYLTSNSMELVVRQFEENCERFVNGKILDNLVDFSKGY